VPEPKIRPEPPEEGEVVVPETAVDIDTLSKVNDASVEVPEGFTVHPKLQRQLSRRRAEFTPETKLDWAHGEALAFGSLMHEGLVVRLTGQDSERGTFSHRHLVLHDAETGEKTTPLATLGSGRLEIHNSPLTESGVVGFEYGYSVASTADLTLWEGQFGDFVNVAQVAIDQFISSGRTKWGQVSNLTLLLPHGYEGQGPEHSSARLERFLQLCAEDNMRVVYPTTPAQYFHLLRRQAMSRPERPLIVMTPKSLLRLPAATSTVSELVDGSFLPVLDDPFAGERRDEIRRLVLCSGKVYYDIQGAKRRDEAPQVAVARLEEIYPFPGDAVAAVAAEYPNLEEVVWVQEEPRNMGALTFVGPRLRAALPRTIRLRHVARPERASPAEGKSTDHQREQTRIVLEALDLEPEN
jgi:2-oxoglutarate dehydrogenase E1 component